MSGPVIVACGCVSTGDRAAASCVAGMEAPFEERRMSCGDFIGDLQYATIQLF
jgi:hypothetical protein